MTIDRTMESLKLQVDLAMCAPTFFPLDVISLIAEVVVQRATGTPEQIVELALKTASIDVEGKPCLCVESHRMALMIDAWRMERG